MPKSSRPGRPFIQHQTDLRDSFWQDPLVAIIMQRLGSGNPLVGKISMEVARLKLLGVELNETIINNLLDHEEETARRLAEAEPYVPARVKRGEPPKPRTASGRWAKVARHVVGPVVYYMRIGNRVKIGTSTNLERRLDAINPEELMALETGGPEIEATRHRQFAYLRTHGEWFKLEGRLAEHIEALRKQQQPTMGA